MGLELSTPSRGKVVLVIAAIAVVILVLVTAYWYMSRPQYPWLFKGAYAVYKGEAYVLLLPRGLQQDTC
jgi:flagellar biosynthesis/type III secretory pathway M-ring protein FliF/YscJ